MPIFVIKYGSLQAKKQNKKLTRVSVTVSLQGIKMTEVSTGDALLDISIYRYKGGKGDTLLDISIHRY